MKSTKDVKAGTGNREPGTGKTEQAPAGAARRPMHLEPRRVAIAAIHVPDDNFRGDNAAKIEALMASMKVHGQQSPVRLRPWNQTGTWSLVFGFRRLMALQRLGETEIDADCHTAPITETEALTIRAIENLERLELNPMEEAVAVCSLLESVTGSARFAAAAMDAESGLDVPASAIQEVAAMLARSQGWVRDRIIFARLSPRVRAALAANLLPLGHAREIAKLADPKAQDEVLSNFIRREDGSGGRDIEYCKRLVAERLRTLKGTKFRLDVNWAGKRDCLSCPHNSAQAHSLFATGGESELADARCLDGECYGVKTEAAERAVETAVKGAQERDIPTTKLGLAMVVPPGMKEAAVEWAILKARGQLPGKTTAGTGNGERGTGKTETNHMAQWRAVAASAIWSDACKTPMQLIALRLGCDLTGMVTWYQVMDAAPDGQALAIAEPCLKLIGTASTSSVYAIAREIGKNHKAMTPEWLEDLHPEVLADLARRWGIKLPPIPGSEAAAAVRTCRVCGCTDANACIDKRTGQACHWVGKDLCSACQKPAKGKAAKNKAAKRK